jgi:ribonuclease HII
LIIGKMLKSRFKDDTIIEIGVDEAGRGSFWGPIMAGAVIIPHESTWSENQRELLTQLRDSKKISPKKREYLFDKMKEVLHHTAVGIVSAKEINDNGISWANMEAFRRAVQALNCEDVSACRLIIDGVLSINDWTGEQELIVDGDAQYMAVAGASIIAKVEHDRWIQNYCESHPECQERYHLLSSKGYGTANHREGIRNYGAHELHRSLYVQNWLPGGKIPTARKKKDTHKCLIKF